MWILFLGIILNALAILIGAAIGISSTRFLSSPSQTKARTWLGVITVILGLQIVWSHLHAPFLHGLKQFGIMLLAMSLGKWTGQLLGLQKSSNQLGQFAQKMVDPDPSSSRRTFAQGFLTCTILTCIAPLAILGAVLQGLAEDWRGFGLKAVIDALAMVSFARLFGISVISVILPVIAWEGSLTLLARLTQPWLVRHDCQDTVLATTGMLVFSVSLLIFQSRRVAVADYLPSLGFAALLSWFWR